MSENKPDLYALLKRLEWSGYQGGPDCCPECGADAPVYRNFTGHKPNCELNAAIQWCDPNVTVGLNAGATP